MKKNDILNKLRNTMIVSCQTSEGNPLYSAQHMALLAQCSYAAGCDIFRVDTPEHIKAIKETIPKAIIIGIWKKSYPNSDVKITPTMKEVEALVASGVDIIAMDGTHTINPSGQPAYTLIKEVRKRYPNMIIMADIATCEDAISSAEAGADMISTTLRGYTKDTETLLERDCDIDFIKQVRALVPCFLSAEGKIWTREHACEALRAGADAIVVGTAINNPKCITERFLEAIKRTAL